MGFGLILFVSFVPMSWAVNEEDIQSKIVQTRKKLTQTKQRERRVLGNLLKAQEELDKINSNLERINVNLDRTEHRMDVVNEELGKAQSELENIKNAIGGRKGVLDQRLITIYKYGYQSYLEVLFQSKNFDEFLYRFDMVSSFVRTDIHIIQSLREQQEIITQKRSEISGKQQELLDQKKAFAELQVKNQAEQNRKIRMMRDTKEELTALQKDRRVLEESLDEMERTSKEMEAQIKNLQDKNKTALGSGRMIWPIRGRITSYFGWRFHPILRKKKYHSGLDIASDMGTPIAAADSGIVIFCGRNGGYGNMIALDHGNEISTVYGHCSVLLVTLGQTVSKGEIIGKVGSTGYSTGPHLHFEVRKEGVPVDPLSSL
jgi:murein DD-endopeptidase MepM/ murein hydrolase activator NlpD